MIIAGTGGSDADMFMFVCPWEATPCPIDVLRLDEKGRAFVAYPEDYDSCLLCEQDSPSKAIKVTIRADVPLELLRYQ